jgi:hypothetical protein
VAEKNPVAQQVKQALADLRKTSTLCPTCEQARDVTTVELKAGGTVECSDSFHRMEAE